MIFKKKKIGDKTFSVIIVAWKETWQLQNSKDKKYRVKDIVTRFLNVFYDFHRQLNFNIFKCI